MKAIKGFVTRRMGLWLLALAIVAGVGYAAFDQRLSTNMGALRGYSPILSSSATTTVTVLDTDSGGTFLYTGTGGAKIYDLPAAAAGLTFTFVNSGSTYGANLEINPASGDNFDGSTDGLSLIMDEWNFNNTIAIVTAYDSTVWVLKIYQTTDSSGAVAVGSPAYCAAR